MWFSKRKASVLLLGAIYASSAKATYLSSSKLQLGITQTGLMLNLAALDKIASDNGGNRAFGLPGFEASVDYILSSLKAVNAASKRFHHGKEPFKVWTQEFSALWSQVQTISLTTTGDTTVYDIVSLTYSPSTPSAGITSEIVVVPGSNVNICTPEAILATGVNPTGKILLIERGLCPDGTTFAQRVRAAAAAGAIGVVLFNNAAARISGGTLTNPSDLYVPAALIQQAEGQALKARIESGEVVTANFIHVQPISTKTTRNIFAETIGGDPNNVIMLGAHLDSVQAGPGINDDGSGSTLLLENLKSVSPYETKNKIRFAWWGAEENGLLGSKFFTENLSPAEVSNLLCYLNFDMVGRGFFGVFDGDGSTFGIVGPAGSDTLEALFTDYFTSKKIVTTPAAFTGGSDYAHFMQDLLVPVGGLHTGTAFEQDPCYHQKCDVYNNVNATMLTTNARAAAHVLSILATNGQELLPPMNSTAASGLMKTPKNVEWTQIEGELHVECRDEL